MIQKFQYACKAAAHEGIARCRNMTPCPVHYSKVLLLAPRPDVVLLKINLNKQNNILFANAGVPYRERSDERREQLGEQHRQRAEKLGRDSLIIRERREGKENVGYPEAHDSGCPVFGSDGLHGVNICGLADQLLAAGFCLTNAYRLDREQKPPIRLVMGFRRRQDHTPESQLMFPWLLVQQLINTCFGQVDVWANDRDPRGQVVHTVNCGQRDDIGWPAFALLYAGGDWGVEQLPADNAA